MNPSSMTGGTNRIFTPRMVHITNYLKHLSNHGSRKSLWFPLLSLDSRLGYPERETFN